MQLAKEADASPTGVVDREHRLGPDLEVGANPYHAMDSTCQRTW